MYFLIVECTNKRVRFIGPFPTFFRANEYAREYIAAKDLTYVKHDVVPLEQPATLKVKFR